MSMCLGPVLTTDSAGSMAPDMVVLVGEGAVATELLNTPCMLAEALMIRVTLPISLVGVKGVPPMAHQSASHMR